VTDPRRWTAERVLQPIGKMTIERGAAGAACESVNLASFPSGPSPFASTDSERSVSWARPMPSAISVRLDRRRVPVRFASADAEAASVRARLRFGRLR
jgi:hypothetical protein